MADANRRLQKALGEVGHACESCSARVGKLFKSGDGRSLCHTCSVVAFWKQRCKRMEVAVEAAHEWSAGFPLMGDASDWDKQVAADVYDKCVAAKAVAAPPEVK